MVRTTPPAKVDATGEAIEFAYEGVAYTIPPASEWDLAALEAFDAEKIATCVKLILGDEQWRAFRAKSRKVSDLSGLFAALNEAVGSPN